MGAVDSVVLKAEVRRVGGSPEARRVRAAGNVPVVVYGEGRNDALQVNAHDFALMMKRHGEHQILDLMVDGQPSGKVLIKEVEHDVVYGHILHADLIAVSMDKPIHLSLPLKVVGDAAGLKVGGVLELIVGELDVECLPADVVEDIPVDVTELNIGDSLTASQIVMPAGLKLRGHTDVVVLTIAHPIVEKEEVPEAAPVGGVGEKKK